MNIKCPKCGGDAMILWGNGWDIEDEFVESSAGARYKEYFFTDEFLKHYSELTEVQNEEKGK